MMSLRCEGKEDDGSGCGGKEDDGSGCGQSWQQVASNVYTCH